MLIRISLIVAILAGLAVGIVNFVQVKEKIVTLKDNLAKETAAHQHFESEYNKTKKELTKTQADLKQTQENLAATTAAKDKAVADLDEVNKKFAALTDDFTKTKKERDDFQAEVSAYKQVFPTTTDAANAGKLIKSLQDTIAGLQGENGYLGKKLAKAEQELRIYRGEENIVLMKKDLHGKILVVDPKWEFVILDIGDDAGVKEYGELLVSRDGKLVAKVIVRNVEKNRSVANIMPGWKLGELMEGDLVVPAHPES